MKIPGIFKIKNFETSFILSGKNFEGIKSVLSRYCGANKAKNMHIVDDRSELHTQTSY